MNKIRRTDQGGSIVTFVIVSVILAASLLGGVYVLNKRGDQVRKDKAVEIANEQKTSNPIINPVDPGSSDKDSSNNKPYVKEADSLPVTGFDFSANEMVGVFLLPMMTTAYVLSRRDLKRCL